MTAPSAAKPRTTNWWVLSVLNGAYSFLWTMLLVSLLQTMVAGLVPADQKETALARVLTVGLLVGLFSYPLSGWVSDRLRHRWARRHGMILLGVTGGVACLAVLPFLHSVAGLTVFFLFVQLLGTVASAPYFALLPDLIPQANRGKASAAMGFSELIGRVLAFITMTAVMGNPQNALPLSKALGLQLTPLYAAVLAVSALMALGLVVGTGLIQFFIPLPLGKNQAQSHATPAAPHPSGITEEQRKRGLVFLILSRIFNQAAIFSVTTFLAYYLKDFLGALTMDRANQWMGTLLMVVTAFTVPTVLLTGWWVDRHGRKPYLVASSLAMLVVCVGFMLVKDLTQACVVGAVFGLALGMFTTSDWALAVDLVPQHEDSAFSLGTWQASLVLGQIVGLPLGEKALSWGHRHWGHPNGYIALFTYVVICLLWALVFLRWVPETLAKKQPAAKASA